MSHNYNSTHVGRYMASFAAANNGADQPAPIVTIPEPLTAMQVAASHAAAALRLYAEVACFHHRRALSRSLDGRRGGTRALAAAAERADSLAGDLAGLVAARYDFTAADARWLEAAFAKVARSRRIALTAAELDFARAAEGRHSGEYHQLRELEHTPAMYAAWTSLSAILDAIGLALTGYLDPVGARLIAAEEIACLQGRLRDWGM